MGKRKTIRVTVRLDMEHDADLIAWLRGLAPGGRSALIRAAWRAGLREPARWEPVDVNELRRVMAEELDRALSGQRLMVASADPLAEESQVDMEAKFGGKLDRMLGGLMADGQRPEDEG
jgi:hypothetical protein